MDLGDTDGGVPIFDGVADYKLNCIFVELYSDPSANTNDQTRVGKYFGMYPIPNVDWTAPTSKPLLYCSFAMDNILQFNN